VRRPCRSSLAAGHAMMDLHRRLHSFGVMARGVLTADRGDPPPGHFLPADADVPNLFALDL
jgi:hypothetical protein